MPVTEVARFSVSYLQILDEQGRLDEALDPHLPDDVLRGMYRAMFFARRVDERLLRLQRQGRIGTFPPTTGQEAAIVGPVSALRPSDWFVPSFRELPGALLRGLKLRDFLVASAGYEEGQAGSAESRNFPTSIILGSQLPHAVGLGYAMRYRGEDAAVLAFCGDGATSEGDFHEALNFAGVWQAPVVFLVQNNHWAISMPRRAQTHSETIAQKAIAYGLRGLQVDGNDMLACHQATVEALDRARRGEGATLIEAVTYRMLMHTTADDPQRYRKQHEVDEWTPRDPLIRARRLLDARGLWDDAREAQLEAEVKATIEEEVKAFEADAQFPADGGFDHQSGVEHPGLQRQRAEFLEQCRQDHAVHNEEAGHA